MDAKGREKGILKLEPRQRERSSVDQPIKLELTPQGSYDRPPSSPQPSVDRLSVTWADLGSMTSGVNLFHLPSDAPANTEVKFSPSTGDGSEDEDYSASLSAVLRQRRASVRRSRKGRARRPSSPFMADEPRSRRRSSVFTTSSGDTAISIDEQPMVSQEQIFENIHLHKEVLGSVKQQPLGMRRKLKIVHQAKGYIKRHEGQLQERLAQSKSTRDIYARFNILLATKWQQLKREAANTSNLLIPWELRIKEIESHFGSVVASYFTFLRWLFWVNLVIGCILLIFVIIPEYLTANPLQDGERKIIMEHEKRNATNLLTLWEFEGILKYSPIFYGYYSNVERPEYRMPLAYFLTGLVVYIYSFVAILRKMAENSRMSKLSEKEDECIFSWKLFTGWDFMIGNAETAHNRIASVILGFKEALLEEAEKKKNLQNWRTISLRAIVNICVIILLAVSAYAVVTVVSGSDGNPKVRSWWRENGTTIVVTVISITFPVFFELLGLLEHYHPRKQLRLQLARIMLLNLLNLYSLIFALFGKIEGMSKELVSLQPNLSMNATITPNSTLDINENLLKSLPVSCYEITVPCLPCDALAVSVPKQIAENTNTHNVAKVKDLISNMLKTNKRRSIQTIFIAQNLLDSDKSALLREIERIKNMSLRTATVTDTSETIETDDNESYEDPNYDLFSSNNIDLGTGTTYDDIEFQTTDSSTNLASINSESTSQSFSDTPTTHTDLTQGEMKTTVTDNYEYDVESLETTTSNVFYSTYDMNVVSITDSNNNYYILNKDYESTRHHVNEITNINDQTISETSTLNSFDFTTESTGNEWDMSSTTRASEIIQNVVICPDLSFNCSFNCGDKNVTQTFYISNCTIVDIRCYITQCKISNVNNTNIGKSQSNTTIADYFFIDRNRRKTYNLTVKTRKKLLKLCWETMFGQELVKITMMDLVFVLLGTLFMDFFRALFVRYTNRCWCWDLEKKFPEYGDFKIAENILHLINNQGMVWMGMFFSPGLVVLNVFKLMIMMYLRSWAVMTCNVPHEVIFRVSKSNNFYLALLLTMLFLCVLPVGYTIVWVTPSWHCGPFSEYDKIYKILTSNIYKVLPKSLNFTLEYMASPAIVIPLLVLLILIIYYLISLTNSLREANNDLKIQLRRERTEERRKMFQLADTHRRGGSTSIDNTPFARWKKALPTLPLSKSIDSDDRKTTDIENKEPQRNPKKKGGVFAKIVGLAIDRKSDRETGIDLSTSPCTIHFNEETDTNFHESLPTDILKIKDISIIKNVGLKRKPLFNLEFNTKESDNIATTQENQKLQIKQDKIEDISDKNAVMQKLKAGKINEEKSNNCESTKVKSNNINNKYLHNKQDSEPSNVTLYADSISSVIPVITISTTESDDEILHTENKKNDIKVENKINTNNQTPETITKRSGLKKNRNCSDLKSLKRQSSVDSVNDNKSPKEKKTDDESGHKYQYSL